MMVAGMDLGDRESLATVLSPTGEVVDRFRFAMNDEGYALFASRVPRDVRIAFEATVMAYPVSRALIVWTERSRLTNVLPIPSR